VKCTIQVVITTEDGQTETREIACLEREDLTLTTLGLTLADGKAILTALQAVVVERQMATYLGEFGIRVKTGHSHARPGGDTTFLQILSLTYYSSHAALLWLRHIHFSEADCCA
jgi:hypothetical protein